MWDLWYGYWVDMWPNYCNYRLKPVLPEVQSIVQCTQLYYFSCHKVWLVSPLVVRSLVSTKRLQQALRTTTVSEDCNVEVTAYKLGWAVPSGPVGCSEKSEKLATKRHEADYRLYNRVTFTNAWSVPTCHFYVKFCKTDWRGITETSPVSSFKAW